MTNDSNSRLNQCNNPYPTPPERTVTVADIDAATAEKRLALLRACIAEENHACLNSGETYWAISAPKDGNPTHTLSENLIWETMHLETPRPIFHHHIFHINGGRYNGRIDIRTQCRSITRHDAQHDVHKCLNRDPLCFKVELDILSYAIHPAVNFEHPRDLDIFHEKTYDRITMLYSHKCQSGRIITCGMFYNHVPPYLAATDGLIPETVFDKLIRSQTVIPDISALLKA